MTPRLVIATGLPGAGGEVATAAAVAVGAASLGDAGGRGSVMLVEVGGERRRGPTMLASHDARRLEEELRGEGFAAAARGALCWVHLELGDEDFKPGDEGFKPGDEGRLAAVRGVVRAADADAWAVFVCLPPHLWRPALEDERLWVAGGLLRAILPAQRPLAALAVRELSAAGARARVVGRAPGAIASRRATAGLDPGGSTGARARRVALGLLGPRPARPVRALVERSGAIAATEDAA